MKSILMFLLVMTVSISAKKQTQKVVVTAVPPLAAIANELVEETAISVLNPFGSETPIPELTEKIKESRKLIDSLSAQTAAVLSLRSILPEDYLFIEMRRRNIRIVEIDAASPLNPTLTAIGTIRQGEEVNPYVWLAPSSVIRSAEIITKDLQALFPDESAKLDKNLQTFRKELRSIRNEYEQKFLKVDQFEVATMDRAFDYLLKDINLFVTLELPGEMDWQESETAEFNSGIKAEAFGAIVHRWVPFGDMAETAEEAKIPFAVLNTGFPGMKQFDEGILTFLRSNLEAIYTALK